MLAPGVFLWCVPALRCTYLLKQVEAYPRCNACPREVIKASFFILAEARLGEFGESLRVMKRLLLLRPRPLNCYSHKGKDVSGKDLAEKQKVKQVKMNMNTFSIDKESEEATMEKQCVGNEGTVREQSSAMKFLVSTLQHRPVVSEYGMLQKVEETGRKLREGYQNAE
ncbi:hypothetical protein Cgig2_012568 [Carnegiea gigantea]|uniref:Uncharacterized protein n=1 Tax=Carnegiea gigantea TaxID=171969 RepID=A0A9Q1QAY5_9CARY|nr:hypothetical protein Cgig2_012568 [Carnegiea gigantea]